MRIAFGTVKSRGEQRKKSRSHVRRITRRLRGAIPAVGRMVGIVALLVVLVGAIPMRTAMAAPSTVSANLTLSGTSSQQSHGQWLIHCDPCAPDALFTNASEVTVGILFNLANQVSWTAPASIAVSYDTDQIRQGSTANLTDTLTTQAGNITVTYSVAYTGGLFAKGGDFPDPGPLPGGWNTTAESISGSLDKSFTATCAPPPSGTTTCTVSQDVNLVNLCCFLDFGVDLDLIVTHEFTVNASGVVAHRIVSLGTPSTRDLTFLGSSPSTVADSFTLDCSPVGTSVYYATGPVTYSPTVGVTGSLDVRLTIEIPLLPDFSDTFNILSGSVFNGTVPMTGSPNANLLLGSLLVDNQPPQVASISQVGTFQEGSPVTFSAVATDNCGASTLDYDWQFSDGGTAFGQSTGHAFQDNGNYTGHLSVTDTAGNVAPRDFNVQPISNLPPTVTGPANAAAYWGVPVYFHADAVDPGAADQPTLQFSWNFNDGSTASGASVNHAFATPGTYSVVISVTDKDGGVGSSTSSVAIAKRPTKLVYNGALSGLPNHYASLSASLTDVLGAPVIARSVGFSLGTQTASALTDATGKAAIDLKLLQKPDSYPLTASFAGDSLYDPSSDGPLTFIIGSGGGGNNGVGGGKP